MHTYVDLLCSLPRLANPFVHRRPPISRVQLQKRLNMLEYGDRVLIRQLSEVFYWGNIPVRDPDEVIVARANRLLEGLPYADMRRWLLWRMDYRTVIAALRRRRAGQDSPASGEVWGYGRYVKLIESNWGHPDFKLENRFPWLPQARSLMDSGDSFGLEKHLLNAAWDYYAAREPTTAFTLPALWRYLMQWDLVERWCSYNADRAVERFEHLVDVALEQPLEQLREMS